MRGRKRKRGHTGTAHDQVEQQNGTVDVDDGTMDVDDIRSFMWEFRRVNMHELMHIDILHQCFKGIVQRTISEWILSILENEYSEV